jgi:hypothetical protein
MDFFLLSKSRPVIDRDYLNSGVRFGDKGTLARSTASYFRRAADQRHSVPIKP